MSIEATKLNSSNTVLVTGGNGFLGRNIVYKLLDLGVRVHILCRRDCPDLVNKGCVLFRGEISDEALVEKASKGCDAVFHTAGKAGIDEPKSEYVRINYQGTLAVIKACKKNGVKRLIYTSSTSVIFADEPVKGGNESLPYPKHYSGYYPETKAMAEKAVLKANGNELATVALRPHLMWGPYDTQLGPRIVSRARAGKFKFVGDGKNKVDVLYVKNSADAHILAAERLYVNSPVSGKAYFITNDDPRPIAEITNMIIEAAGAKKVTSTINLHLAFVLGFLCEKFYKIFKLKGEPPITRWVALELATDHWFDISAAKRDLSYKPKISIEEGIAELKQYYSKQSEGK